MGQYKKELKNWKVIIIMIIIFALAYVFYNIDYLLCGTLSYEYQNRIDKVQKEYSSLLSIEVIPCEFRYINVKLKHNNFQDTVFHKVHSLLYDASKGEGWITLLIFDNQDKYLYSHSSNNKFYRQKGD